MKRKLFFFFFIITAVVHGQTSVYHPFPDSNAVWNVNYSALCPFGFINVNYSIDISGDTIIASQAYHKLNTPYIEIISAPCTFGMPSVGYKGAIRHDSINKKVFYVPPSDSTEQLLYDFNLQVGDTVKGFLEPLISPDQDTVQSIDSVLVGTNYRKRWNINPCYSIAIIEGIGSTFGLIQSSPGCATDFPYYSVTCFSQNNVVLYPEFVSSCNLIDEVNDGQGNISLHLFPNPTGNQFTIYNLRLTIEDVEIYSSLGEKVYSQKQTANSQKQKIDVDTHSWSVGVYFVRIKISDGVIVKKLVKQ